MKGKYSKKKKKKTGVRWLLAVLILLVLAVAALWIVAMNQEDPEMPPPETTGAPQPTEATVFTEATETQAVIQEGEEFHPINLGYGVSLDQVSKYTGIYMEDGSDELLSGIMMIRISNTGEDDIQLMHIEVAYSDASYHFQVTNLPAGSSAILLELSRSPVPRGIPQSAVASNVVLFREPMRADAGVYEISGAAGMMNVKNISGTDIPGDIYVYYKYKTQDVFYGGITFRVAIPGGLKAGEIRQVVASHFNPDNCQVIMVEAVQQDGN